MNDWIVKNRIIRRVLVFALTFLFIKVTINLFSGTIQVTKEITVIYGILASLVTLILKFYLQGTKDQTLGD